jgi:2-polyprenyl-6-hydroxyphenyl methylase/3-demethylubiquinone-9 3-methyltransferase
MINFDVQEVNKFSELSSDWWNLQGAFKTLHEINPLRLQFIQSHLSLSDAKIIDIGCGGGILAESLAQAGAIVTGIDMSAEAIKTAQNHWENSTFAIMRPHAITYQQTTAENMAESYANTFDALTCMELLEHVPDPVSVIQACAKLVKPGGHLFFSTINRNPKAYLFAILGAEYLLNIIPKGTHDFAKFIKPSEFASWARQANLSTQEFKGLHYNPLTKNYWLNNDISVNYLVHCQRIDY